MNFIKEITNIAFWVIGTIIAVLTYNRAKYTLLQPLRAETIKKQFELFSELLELISNDFESKINYPNMVTINVFCAIRDYGFIFSEDSTILKDIDKETQGWVHCGESNTVQAEIISTFENEKKDTLYQKNRYENLKKGIASIDRIYLTKPHSDTMSELRKLGKNPFMPKSIMQELLNIEKEIHINNTVIMKKELESFMLEFSKKYSENKIAPKFNPIGVYNNFNHKRIHHYQRIKKLRYELRRYLLIDLPW